MKTTKELARELGLLRKRTLSSTSAYTRGTGSSLSTQIFKYLIVIDFESTCWQDAKFRTQEIIEFPAVLLNTLSGEVESEFHHYVQPQEQPTLSIFCTELTGITQSQVDEGIPVGLCLRKFGHWLDRLYRDKRVVCQGTAADSSIPVNTTCVTWSDWDLGVCLQYECKRKQLMKPAQLNSWIDLRATYRKFYDRKPNGLNGALQDVGIEFQGREHSGVDDARNTAKLAYRMIRDGCHMKVTKTLKTHERSVSCNPTIPMFVAKATRVTPPRKAKQKTATESSFTPVRGIIQTLLSKKSPSKIPVRIKTPGKSSNTKLESTAADCDTCMCSVETKFENGNSSGEIYMYKQKVKSVISQKRKQFTPVKDTGKISTQSPRRKIQRKFSPKKITAADIYVDSVSGSNEKDSPNKVADNRINKGLTVQDTNVQADRKMHSQSKIKTFIKTSETGDSDGFKIPNTVSANLPEQSTFKIPIGSVTPKTGVGNEGSKKGHFVTSTPLNGNSNACGFNQSKLVSPVTSPASSFNGMSVWANLADSKRSFTVTPGSTFHNSTGFRTPCQTPSFNSTKQYSGFSNNSSSMKITPPLCKCGRRSRRRMVQSPGQNMGRFFFSCAVRKRVGSKEGCEFFKWETSTIPGQSVSMGSSMISKQFTPVARVGTTQALGISQKKSLGVRAVPSQNMLMR